MNITVLTTSFPPFADSQTIRTLYLTRALQAPHWRWSFVVPAGGGADGVGEFRNLMPTGSRVVRTAPVMAARINRALEKLPLSGLTRPVAANLWYRFGRPDSFAGWQEAAVRSVEQGLDALCPDVLISSSGSATAHLAAARLSERHGIPWVADYGDPWHLVDSEARPWLARWSARVERDTIRHASHVIFTTDATLDAYRAWLGSDMPPASVLPYGFVADEYPDEEPGTEVAPRISLAHVGAAYTANRNLVPLVRAVAAYRDAGDASTTGRPAIALRIVGNQSRLFRQTAEKLGLDDAEFAGRVGYEEAISWTRKSDVLVIVGNRSTLQIPGKVFVALGARKPILYIGQSDEDSDPAWQLLRPFGGVLYARNEVGDLHARLTELAGDFVRIRASARSRGDDGRLKGLEAGVISEHFGSVLASLIPGRRGGKSKALPSAAR